jgi:transketolase
MLQRETEIEIKRFSCRIHTETVKTIAKLGSGHLGGSLSIADLLAVLYHAVMRYDPENPRWEGRDWLVCSKGHAGPAVYSALALKGFMPLEELNTLNAPYTNLPSHCDRFRTKGIDMTTGSLGQGASTAAGIALAHKLKGMSNMVYLIMGDGELNEGQVWEMAMFANHRKLDNMIAFVDCNKLQIDGRTDDICDLGDIAGKFREFGWHSRYADGHDVADIYNAIEEAKAVSGVPSVIVLHTVKGHGWGAVENTAGSHSLSVSSEQLRDILEEMEKRFAV